MKTPSLFSFFFLVLLSCNNKNASNDPVAYHNPVVQPYTDAIAEEPDNPKWYFKRSEALAQVNADSLRIVDLEKAVELDGKNPMYFQALGIAYLDMDQAEKAVAALQKNLELSPGEVRVRLLLSKAYLSNDQIQFAQKEVDKVLAAAPDYPDAIYWQAQIKAAEKDTLSAIQLIKKALEIDSSYYLASYQLADFYAAQNDGRTVAQYQKTFRMDTMNVAPLFDIGEFYKSKNEWENAKKAYRESVLKDPDYSDAYLEIGEILVQQDSIEKALRQFNIAILTNPEYARAYYNKGLCFEKLNMKDSAQFAYAQALVFNPHLSEAGEGIKRLK